MVLRPWHWIVGAVVVLLVGVRLALPTLVQSYVNKVLDENPEYDGHVGDVDIHLYRGAYSIHQVEIVKTEGTNRVPFFAAQKVDLSVAWKELFEGKINARLIFTEPKVNFVDGKKIEKQTGKDASWDKMLDELVPFEIARLEVERGEVHFRNFNADPPVDLWIKDLQALVTNLTNSTDSGKDLFASASASGRALGDGELAIDVRLNPRAKKPTFDLNAKLMKLDLTKLNPFFKKYAKLDFEKGRADIVAQLAANEGKMKGYVKPLFRGLEVFSWKKDVEQEGDSIFTVIWEAIAGTVIELFENQPKDQFATKIPIQGSLDNPDIDIWTTIGGVLSNAFVHAFSPFYDEKIKLTRDRRVSAKAGH